MKRKVVSIDERLCNGCGTCIPKCAEGALQIINGKAKLVKDAYCDGLGACIGQCPQNAITVTEREADPFNEAEVQEYLKSNGTAKPLHATTCPQRPQWPIKIDLISPKAPFLQNADLLVAADCAPVALKSFHDLMLGKTVLIGCPKFNDARAYAAKFTDILLQNNINSITVLHMEVPCCTGLKWAINKALENSNKKMHVRELEVKIGGDVIDLR